MSFVTPEANVFNTYSTRFNISMPRSFAHNCFNTAWVALFTPTHVTIHCEIRKRKFGIRV